MIKFIEKKDRRTTSNPKYRRQVEEKSKEFFAHFVDQKLLITNGEHITKRTLTITCRSHGITKTSWAKKGVTVRTKVNMK